MVPSAPPVIVIAIAVVLVGLCVYPVSRHVAADAAPAIEPAELPRPRLLIPSSAAIEYLAFAAARNAVVQRQVRDAVDVTRDMAAPNSSRARAMRMMGLMLLNREREADRRELAFCFLISAHNLVEGDSGLNPAAAILDGFDVLDPMADPGAAAERYLAVAEKYGVRRGF